jgi:triacylglycerol esterase/lipase EstA (alpha/beta hydrolase family)
MPRRQMNPLRTTNMLLPRVFGAGLAVLLAVSSFTSEAAAEPASTYRRQSANAETVIVFVHGFWGDAASSWTSSSGVFWPELLTKDPEFDKVDIFIYSYRTGPSATLTIDELAEDMRRTLTAKHVTAYKKIIFLSHSMGGLITRAYLLKNRATANRTAFAYFFSTPTSGSQIASIANLLLSSAQIAKMILMLMRKRS